MKGIATHERECQTSEEEEEESGNSSSKKTKSTGTDGGSIEVVRRPRGRPPGSKNKPKPPIFITREITESSMRPHILEVPSGLDVVGAISRFVRLRNIGLCVLAGNGTVANVTLRHPTSASTTSVTFPGRFEILSISATFLPPPSDPTFTVSLAGAQGHIVGGSVIGSLLSATTVIIVAAALVNPTFHRLPGEEEDEISASGVGLSEAEMAGPTHFSHHQHLQHQHQHQQQEHHGHGHLECSNGSNMSVYSCHLPSDVIWPPSARAPPPF